MTAFELFQKIDTEVASLAADYDEILQGKNPDLRAYDYIRGYLDACDDIGSFLSKIHNDPDLRSEKGGC